MTANFFSMGFRSRSIALMACKNSVINKAAFHYYKQHRHTQERKINRIFIKWKFLKQECNYQRQATIISVLVGLRVVHMLMFMRS